MKVTGKRQAPQHRHTYIYYYWMGREWKNNNECVESTSMSDDKNNSGTISPLLSNNVCYYDNQIASFIHVAFAHLNCLLHALP